MAKYKPYDYGHRMMIPVSLEEQVVPRGSPEEFVEGDGEEGGYGEGARDLSSAD